jgi:hypothetical protein
MAFNVEGMNGPFGMAKFLRRQANEVSFTAAKQNSNYRYRILPLIRSEYDGNAVQMGNVGLSTRFVLWGFSSSSFGKEAACEKNVQKS